MTYQNRPRSKAGNKRIANCKVLQFLNSRLAQGQKETQMYDIRRNLLFMSEGMINARLEELILRGIVARNGSIVTIKQQNEAF